MLTFHIQKKSKKQLSLMINILETLFSQIYNVQTKDNPIELKNVFLGIMSVFHVIKKILK